MIGPIRAGRRRRAFTLLEVLLAALLSVVLLAAVWSLYTVYANLFEKGEARTEQAQLVRSLMRQISDDLRSAIQDTASRPPQTPATTPLRRFGLFGTAQSLQLDILRAAPRETDLLPPTLSDVSTADAPIGPKAPEFRTVQYEFVEPVGTIGKEGQPAPMEEDEDVHAGLTRRELDWEIPVEARDDGLRRQGTSLSVETTFGSTTEEGTAERPPLDDTVLYVPEVVSLGFRYFDGHGWTSVWNSIQRKSLPAAIEVTMQIEPAKTTKQRLAERAESAGQDDRSTTTDEDSRFAVHDATAISSTEDEPVLPTHRIVVYLPVSPLQKPPKARSATTMPIPASVPSVKIPPVVVPRATAPVPTGRRRVFTPAPADERMRNE